MDSQMLEDFFCFIFYYTICKLKQPTVSKQQQTLSLH